MKSSSGAHYIALDHVRAVAVLLVVVWHFTHGLSGYPVPYDGAPTFIPAALLDEGQTGVALFMTLSGYLFAKLLDGRAIRYGAFLRNRVLRLVPLLALVLTTVGVQQYFAGQDPLDYAWGILRGLVLATLPHGAWSIMVEFHFYLVLPLLLWLAARSRSLLLGVVWAAIALRIGLYAWLGEIQTLAYWTLVGRIDQFTLGMLAFHFRGRVPHWAMALVAGGFLWFFWRFDQLGGFFNMPSYPSPSPLWIMMPTIEGAAYAVAIAWYDRAFAHAAPGAFSRFVGRMGAYSYSIYLMHCFVVFAAARLVHEHIMDISSFHAALPWALAFFVAMYVPGYLSFRFIESPFLRLRVAYTTSAAPQPHGAGIGGRNLQPTASGPSVA